MFRKNNLSIVILLVVSSSLFFVPSISNAGPISWICKITGCGKKSLPTPSKSPVVKKPIYTGPSTIDVISISLLSSILVEHGIQQIEGHTIEEDVSNAFSQGDDYQTRLCKNPSGSLEAIPDSFDRCPYDSSEIAYGPTLYNNT